jgi:hypothetical protein
VTGAEEIAVEHIKRCAATWRYTRAEILAHAEHHASLDPFGLARLPGLMLAEIDKSKAKREAVAC